MNVSVFFSRSVVYRQQQPDQQLQSLYAAFWNLQNKNVQQYTELYFTFLLSACLSNHHVVV